MKTSLAIIVFFPLFAFATPKAAKAETRCGTLEQRNVRPVCKPHEMCPQYTRVAHFLKMNDDETLLETASLDILNQIVNNVGQRVCVHGEQPPQEKYFEVDELTPDKK